MSDKLIDELITDITKLKDVINHENTGTISRCTTIFIKLIKLKLQNHMRKQCSCREGK